MGLLFEWDPEKASANERKHRVSFDEASTVFSDPLSLTIFDPNHSDDEDRYLTIGMSREGKVLVVSFTERGDVIRLISSRIASKRERKQYEEGS